VKTYSIRLFPTAEQEKTLYRLSSIRCEIYNSLLQIQQRKYAETKKIFNRFDLINLLPTLKKEEANKHWSELNSKAIQTIATELSQNYQSFFSLIKKDNKAKPPREIDSTKFHSITFNQSGWAFRDNNIIVLNRISIKFKGQFDNVKDLPIKEVRLKLVNEKWLLDLVVDDKQIFSDKKEISTKVLALDLGLKRLATGVDNSGNQVIILNKSKKINKYFCKHIDKIKSKLSKKVKNSRSYKRLNNVKRELYKKKNVQIKQTLHTQSKKLVSMNYNTIVIGDLRVKKLIKKRNNSIKGIRKSFSESNISMFLSMLAYKSQAKQQSVIKINETHTTQLNCLTNKLFANKVDLTQREVEVAPGLVIDRDLNSALNILKRYQDNHLASVNEPLVVTTNVLQSLICRKPIIL
jgi:IS605 OrfB family transposase